MTDINLLGRTLGPFEIISELGRGGMAVFYKARQTNLDRTIALKILPPELSLDKSYLARFLHEARNAAALEAERHGTPRHIVHLRAQRRIAHDIVALCAQGRRVRLAPGLEQDRLDDVHARTGRRSVSDAQTARSEMAGQSDERSPEEAAHGREPSGAEAQG